LEEKDGERIAPKKMCQDGTPKATAALPSLHLIPTLLREGIRRG
jgi:hypothetical protein